MASAAAHALALSLALAAVPQALRPPPEPRPISVEIVSSNSLASQAAAPNAASAAAVADQGAAPDRLPSEPEFPAATVSKTITASSFYAAGVLAGPGMERIRRTLSTFADSEKIVQLCNIEGIEQIRRAAPQYAPDTIVSYAMSDPITHGLTLIANGAAFRSRRRWYGVSFSCTAAARLDGVAAFSFQIGEAIPESEWDAHNLNAEDSDE
jgi:hypothetical protein